MVLSRGIAVVCFLGSIAYGATFGTVVPVTGGVSDLILDEARSRLYLINSNRNQVDIYSTTQRRFLDPIAVDQQPLSGAISRTGKFLYVACHLAGSLVTLDLDTLQVVSRLSLPARPEGVAVGSDDRVLISTVGTGQGNQFNVLLIYDPSAGTGSQSLAPVPVSPPRPLDPLLPQQSFGRPALANRSFLTATPDGRLIFGVNIPANNLRTVFVYEAASGSVLRSRSVAGLSNVLSVAPDGSRFMAGLHLFDTATLNILAQQNAANSPYPFPQGTNFNLQQNQGGSVYSPDGSYIYSAFNFAPLQNPAARPNISQLMLNDPANLLIHTAFQLPENLAGKMVISSDGETIYAISDSGILLLPMGQARTRPIITLASNGVYVANDQCGLTERQRSGMLEFQNQGSGRYSATAQLFDQPAANVPGLGGAGGPGGGLPGGIIIIVPPVAPPGAGQPGGQPVPPGGAAGGAANTALARSSPIIRPMNTPSSTAFQVSFNTANLALGTVSPPHQYTVSSQEAINIPPAFKVYQNNRNSESRGDIMPVETGLSANEGLVDIAMDTRRNLIFVANSGFNRVEVFDMRTNKFLAPIKVGQLPRSIAITPDNQTMYVANSGGENISVVDLDSREVVGRVNFPAIPFNNNSALIFPQVITATQRGLLMVMSDGTLWRVIGNEAVPRRFNTTVIPTANNGTQVIPAPRSLASTPNGEFALLLAGNGNAYLYDAVADDFIQARQVITGAISGYYGAVAAGPRGQYFLVNGFTLNQSLTPVGNAGQVPAPGPERPGVPTPVVTRPIASVAAVGANVFARFAQPVIANANAAANLQEPATVELVNATTGQTMRTAPALERPLTTPTGNQRANIPGRTMVVDPAGTTAYVLTASGLSVVPLEAPVLVNRPAVNPRGAVNLASYRTELPQGGLISIFGRSLGADEVASNTPLPTRMGGACVTLNNRPIPLFMTSASQINAQIPTTFNPGRYTMVVRNLNDLSASLPQTVDVFKYAPAVFVDPASNQAAIFHPDGRPVTPDNPARRDRRLVLYATGLGPTRGGAVRPGEPAPSEPLALTDPVKVFFGDPTYNGSEIVVEWSGLVPGFISLYQLNLYVPGLHLRGDDLPITIRLGNVDSPKQGPLVPVVAVD